MYNKEALRKLLEDCWGACIENTMRPHSDRYEKPPKHPDRDTYITSQLSAMEEEGEIYKEKAKEIARSFANLIIEGTHGVNETDLDHWVNSSEAKALLSGEDWISVEKPPDIGDEYLVVYDLEDGDEPLTTAMQFDAKENKWYDERAAGAECKTVLFWMPLPEPPKIN